MAEVQTNKWKSRFYWEANTFSKKSFHFCVILFLSLIYRICLLSCLVYLQTSGELRVHSMFEVPPPVSFSVETLLNALWIRWMKCVFLLKCKLGCLTTLGFNVHVHLCNFPLDALSHHCFWRGKVQLKCLS